MNIDPLLFEYGALMHDFEHSKCVFERHKLVGKMNAINTLLDLPLIELNDQFLLAKQIFPTIKEYNEQIKKHDTSIILQQ